MPRNPAPRARCKNKSTQPEKDLTSSATDHLLSDRATRRLIGRQPLIRFTQLTLECTEAFDQNLTKVENLAKESAKANEQIRQNIKLLRDALIPLTSQRRPASRTKLKVLADSGEGASQLLATLNAELALTRALRHALDCTQALISSTQLASCPGRQELIQDYFDDKDGPFATSAGSTDCHTAPININTAL